MRHLFRTALVLAGADGAKPLSPRAFRGPPDGPVAGTLVDAVRPPRTAPGMSTATPTPSTSMQITVVLRPDAAAELRAPAPAQGAARTLLDDARDLGVELRPTHPGVDDASLQPFYHVEVNDPDAVERVLDRLRASAAVDAAYVKPAEAAP